MENKEQLFPCRFCGEQPDIYPSVREAICKTCNHVEFGPQQWPTHHGYALVERSLRDLWNRRNEKFNPFLEKK